jgi:hypothetical protein
MPAIISAPAFAVLVFASMGGAFLAGALFGGLDDSLKLWFFVFAGILFCLSLGMLIHSLKERVFRPIMRELGWIIWP